MFLLARRAIAHAPKESFLKRPQRWHMCQRHISSTAISSHSSSNISVSALAGLAFELDRLAPRIDINADQIEILSGPSEFYETLKTLLRGAKKRIFVSTLYIGKSEHELVACLREALEKNPGLKVSILTDALRGTRETPEPSCASLLAPLAADFPSQVEIRMYHTPKLTGLRKRLIPKRINEGWGLQHMKLYGIDDAVILSGANLSSDYFTNRQDRYHLVSSQRATDYYAQIHETMCSVSFLLKPGKPANLYTLVWPEENAAVSPLRDPKGYTATTTRLFTQLTQSSSTTSPQPSQNTVLYPIVTIPDSVNTELPAIQSLLSPFLPSGSTYVFTAGYFNPHPAIADALLSCSARLKNAKFSQNPTICTVLTASPWANGFYGSKGISGMLPPAYTLLSRRFLEAAQKIAPGAVELREWRRGTVGTEGGWTYHAKGLWLTLPPSHGQEESKNSYLAGPSVTVIGSSNYTTRSYSLDTEVGAVVITRDPGLQEKLQMEEERLLRNSKSVNEEDLRGGERRVGLGVRVAMWIVKVVGGSL